VDAASHLGIDLREYDQRIRTFIPGYGAMLDIAASVLRTAVAARTPLVVDLGVGTGALSARCKEEVPSARLIGVDEDAAMLAAARARLGRKLKTLHGDFESVPLPRCDAFVACLALHHIPTRARRLRLFRRMFRALRPGGVIISADCHPASSPRQVLMDLSAWLGHLEQTYTAREARGYLKAWSREDHYVPLVEEIGVLQRSGFTADVPGRAHAFAVVLGTKGRQLK
jgi:SAM-dependent methyltransferase